MYTHTKTKINAHIYTCTLIDSLIIMIECSREYQRVATLKKRVSTRSTISEAKALCLLASIVSIFMIGLELKVRSSKDDS